MAKFKNAEMLMMWMMEKDERKKKRINNIIIMVILLLVMSVVSYLSFISGFNAGVEEGIKMSFSPFYLQGLNAGRGMPRYLSAIHHDDIYKVVWAIRDGSEKKEKSYVLLEKKDIRIFFQLNDEEAKKISDFSAGISELQIENGKIKNIFFDFNMCNFFRLSEGGKKVFQYCRSE